MASPFRHQHTSNHHDAPPPPPQIHHEATNHASLSGVHHQNPPPPPPPQVVEVHHSSHNNHLAPPGPPPPPHVVHVEDSQSHVDHHSRPNIIDGLDSGPGWGLGELGDKATYKIYCKAGGDQYCVTIRDAKVLLTNSDSHDLTQHWIKDEKYSTKVKDSEGCPSFSLVNKSTGQVLKHTVAGQSVQLIQYKANASLDESILWTESHDLGSGFRTIRMVNNIKLVMDAFHGDKNHGGVHDGTLVALYESWKGDNQNQQWRIHPHSH